jgi:para-nitrobenzyl esterase
MAPQPPQPWSSVRDAFDYVGHALQSPNRPKRRPELETILGPADTTLEGEDCLNLNVWTRGLGDGAKRPVMVWFDTIRRVERDPNREARLLWSRVVPNCS